MNENGYGTYSLLYCLSQLFGTEIIFDTAITLVIFTVSELVIDRTLNVTGSRMNGVEITRYNTYAFLIFHIINDITVNIIVE